MGAFRAAAALAGASIGTASPAHAHLVTTGLGPLYDGLAHPFLTPEQALPIVALTLLAGLRGPPGGRLLLAVLPISWLAGYAISRTLGLPAPPPAVGAGALIALGVLVAADRPWPVRWVGALAALVGLADGGAAGAELAQLRASHLVALGSVCSLLVLVSLLAGQVAAIHAFAARVAVRAAGGWIAAIGLFMAGWAWRGG
jgi:hydrogenase/urease accessory protein HupE